MKIKSEILAAIIVVCILFSISAVSANENQFDAVNTTNNYQSNIELNLETNDIANISNDVLRESTSINENLKEETANFTQFHDDVINSGNTFDMTHDYTYENDSETSEEIRIENLTINGNNHVLDGLDSNFSFMFYPKINGKTGEYTPQQVNLVINDLTFKNFRYIALWICGGNVTLNNVTFTNCFSDTNLLITVEGEVNFTLNKCNFHSNLVYQYMNLVKSRLIVNNTNFSGNECLNNAITIDRGQLIVENCLFENFTAEQGGIIGYKGDRFVIRNSKFLNSKANATGGAILAKYFPLSKSIDSHTEIYYPSDAMLIENCVFSNLSSASNGGAIHLDLDSGSEHVPQSLIVINSNFTDCSSKFGGAISILGGSLNISKSYFKNNNAGFEGGAIYSSWTGLNITDSSFENNTGIKNAGALFFDKGRLAINATNFINNNALEESNNTANAIYAHDVDAYFSDSVFDNGGIGVYADFVSNSEIKNVDKNDDIFLMDNHDYIVSVESKGVKLNLTKNEIIVDTLPSRFDARDWGWVSPVKIQNTENDDCWAFATVASLESSLLKATGQCYNLSVNYVQKLQLKYFKAGDKRISLTGFSYSGLGYALNWYGVLPVDNIYDYRGMIADTDLDDERIHVQDAKIIYTGQEDTVDQIKWAILKYGSVTVQYYVIKPKEDIPTEGDDISIMDHATHFISLIGWDDNFYENAGEPSEDNPNPKFAWIMKDSLGGFSETPYNTFSNIDYYAIAPQSAAIAYIFENNISYHVNYQTDLTGLAGFDGNYTIYSNEFISKYNELIGAVGTYFNESGINYTFDIMVNNKVVHTQSGVIEFAGFRTIVLDKYIPIKTGDKFKVVFKSNSVPYQAWSRVHYLNGTSLASKDGTNWIDFAPLNKTVCLKAYTVIDDTKLINNKDIKVDYAGGKYFSVKIVTADGRAVGAGEKVKFTINGKSTTVTTDNNGIAKIKITQTPKKYTITTTYKGKSVKNTVTVKQVLSTSKVTVKKTAKKFTLKAKLKINGKLIKGKVIKFKFNGKTYKAKTNSKGIAQVTVKKNVIKKLKTGKTYAVKVTYSKDTIKTTVKVKR